MLKVPKNERSDVPPKTRLGQGWCLPSTIRKFGSNLLAQQIWCWGQDIEHPDDNLLTQFGFQRHRDHENNRSSCYRLDQGSLHIALWGFGLFFGAKDQGGLYLGRFEFDPVWSPLEQIPGSIHWPDDLPEFCRPSGSDQWKNARQLLSSLSNWIADYEEWVAQTIDIDYRKRCVESWLRPFVKAEQMSQAWGFLGQRSWESSDEAIGHLLKSFTI